MKIGDSAEAPTRMCVYALEDGTIYCAPCDAPPENSELKGYAPKGTRAGIVDAEILNRLPVGE